MKSYPIFEFAEQCLHSDSIQQKLDLTATACRLWREGRFECDFEKPPKPISATRFSKRPELVDPRELPRRNMASKEGRIALLHAIAHIEFYAIHLAWDIIYRFQDMPQLFYGDWLGVAAEEAQHFSLIRKRLQELDSDYGLLPAHRGLWEVAEDTDHDVLARLALVPRYMEARGLDVTPGMIEKLRGVGDHSSAQILVTIVNEEVGHVLIGSRWFHTVCAQRNLDPEQTYFDLLNEFLRGTIRGPFNYAFRKRAGFSDAEIQRLEALSKTMSPKT